MTTMPTGGRIWTIYLMAFIPAAAAAWVILAALVGQLFASGTGRMPMAAVFALPVLAGLSVFALVYGMLAGSALRLKFWLAGTALCGGVFVVMIWAIFTAWPRRSKQVCWPWLWCSLPGAIWWAVLGGNLCNAPVFLASC